MTTYERIKHLLAMNEAALRQAAGRAFAEQVKGPLEVWAFRSRGMCNEANWQATMRVVFAVAEPQECKNAREEIYLYGSAALDRAAFNWGMAKAEPRHWIIAAIICLERNNDVKT